jgi:hypothetical protein
MNTHQAHTETRRISLGNGLTLRYSTAGDIDRLVEFNARVLTDDEAGKPDVRVGHWTRDLLTLHNYEEASPFGLLIEEDTSHRIASALISIPQTWTFAGIPFSVGRPEPVGTDKDFRGRGLVRTLFQEFHRNSQERGDLLQGITGIPYFYRQFGYEMAVELGGSRSAYEAQVKAAAKVDKAGRSVRLANQEDIPFLCDCFKASASRYLLHCPLGLEWWTTELYRKHPDSAGKQAIYILESAKKQPAGFFILSKEMDDQAVVVRYIEIRLGINWRDYMPLMIEQSWAFGQELSAKLGKPCSRLCVGLGSQHPAYLAAAEFLPEWRKPYNWYLRVPDLPKLILRVAPVLEKRIAQSPFCDYTGKLKICFYKSDLHLEFQSGALAKAETAPASVWHEADVCFPDLTFLQLFFGHRSSRELSDFFADCRISEKYIPLLDAIFPKQTSLILPIE